MTQLIIEALVVGLITGVVGFLIATGLMFFNDNFSLKDYHFWFRVMLGYFLTGFILHLLFEAVGTNKWYCKNGNACSK